jgi:hypothetical protein
MLRFFRKIRQKLLTDNKFSKYLLYAIGEILLVVIGILIALQVDHWNQKRENEEKVRSILSDIMLELVSDIDKINNLMHYYKYRDSAAFLVITNQVTEEDYEKNEIPTLSSITSFHNRVDLTQDGYSLLTQNMDIIPYEYKSVLKNLTRIYKVDKRWVDTFDQEMGDFVEDISYRLMRTYPWYTRTNPSDRKRQIEYMLNDFRHRNEVYEYRNIGIGNQLRFSLNYRRRAIQCYKEIALLLDKPVYHESFMFDQEASKNLIGDWEVVGQPEIIFSFYEDDRRVFFKDNINPGSKEIFWLPPTKILRENLLYGTLVEEGDEHLIKFNSFDLKKVD